MERSPHVLPSCDGTVTGALALEFQPVQSVSLRASSTQLFKVPELSEVFIGAGLYDELSSVAPSKSRLALMPSTFSLQAPLRLL